MEYFTHEEFDEQGAPGSGQLHMDGAFLDNIDTLRGRCGFPLRISSGYRSPEYNNRVSSTGLTGPHTTGKAADVACSREKAYIVLREAMSMGCFTGIGISQRGSHRFIHLDSLTEEEGFPRSTIWSY